MLHIGLMIVCVLSCYVCGSKLWRDKTPITTLDWRKLLGFFSFCVFLPALEELIFRKILQEYLDSWHLSYSREINALIFGSVHIFNITLTESLSIWYNLYQVAMATYIGWIYCYMPSLWTSFFYHVFHNTTVITVTTIICLYNRRFATPDPFKCFPNECCIHRRQRSLDSVIIVKNPFESRIEKYVWVDKKRQPPGSEVLDQFMMKRRPFVL